MLKKTVLIIFITLLFSCEDPLSMRDSSKTYDREFANKSQYTILNSAKKFIDTRLKGSVIDRDYNDLAGSAEKMDFDGRKDFLVYRFVITASNNKYELFLSQMYKLVHKVEYDPYRSGYEREELTTSDYKELISVFNEIDRQMYDYIREH